MKTIDLRSDTVTRPTQGMRKAMAEAEVGDDVYGEDPTVNRLEARVADRLGFEAALFVCSGTQGNLLALLAHCGRGDEFIAGQQAHIYRHEGGGGAVLGGLQPQPLDFEDDGSLDLEKVAGLIKPRDHHFARTRLLCLENTQGGRPLAPDYLERAGRFARMHGLALHLDGARLFNAAVSQGVAPETIVRPCDSVEICLSKGLGAPAGSMLCGGRDFIAEARRWRKVVGGGLRQAGVLAAAGIYALEHHVERLAEDHSRAEELAERLAGVEEVRVEGPFTNMIFLHLPGARRDQLVKFLHGEGIRVGGYGAVRLATHLDVGEDAPRRVAEAVQTFFRREA